MIELGLVDLSAEGRRRLSSLVERWSWAPPDSRISVPRLSMHLLSPEEVRFHGNIDVCVIGPELIRCDAAYVNNVRQQLPDKIIICVLDTRTYSFGLVEQLGRLGVDDVLVDSATSDEFFRRILLLQRRVQAKKRGKLVVVDGARGGVGRTFVAASVAEGWFAKGLRVCLVDCDVVSQDLTRFLQVRPHLNEPLRLLVEQQRVVTSETVSECVRNVWMDESRFGCMAPPAGCDESLFASPHAQRGLIAVLDALLIQYDRVVVDASGLISGARNALFQVSDEVIFVVNRDASAAFANRQALSLIAGFMRPDARLVTVMNDTGVGTASRALLRDQVVVIAGRAMSYVTVPRSARGAAWVCSGYTPYRFLSRNLQTIVDDQGGELTERSPLHRALGRIALSVQDAARRLFALLGIGWGRKSRVSASNESWGERVELGASPLLGIEHQIPEDGVLVTKPVLLN